MSRKTLLIALFGSLALNLFLVGTVAGGLVVGQKVRSERPPVAAQRPNPPLWRAGDALPPDQAQAYRRALRDQSPEVRESMRAARVARMEAWRTLGQEPFDPVAAKRRLAAIRAQEADARGRIEDDMVDFAAGLSLDERRILVRGLTERGRQPHAPMESRR